MDIQCLSPKPSAKAGWCDHATNLVHGDVSFDLISVHDLGGVDYGRVFDGLKLIGYDGTVTVHQSANRRDARGIRLTNSGLPAYFNLTE